MGSLKHSKNHWRATKGRYLYLLVSIIFCACANTAMGAEPTNWRIKHFDVVQAEPWTPGDPVSAGIRQALETPSRLVAEISPVTADALMTLVKAAYFTRDEFFDPVEVAYPLTWETKKEMETYLEGAARLLQEWGFPEPHLTDVVTRSDGKKAYRVYYTNLSNAAGLYDWGFFNLPTIFVDANIMVGKKGVKPSGYGTLGHELFHAVEYAMPFFRSSGRTVIDMHNPWLDEGMADAVGWDIYRKLRPGKEGKIEVKEFWGQRDYSRELVVERPSTGFSNPSLRAYHTASFWRYLAEVNFYKRRAPRRYLNYPGSGVNDVDYSYLSTFLQYTTPIENGDDELDWLDAMTRQYEYFKVPVRDYFAEFLVAYHGYADDRLRETHSSSHAWIMDSFERLHPGGADDDPDSVDGIINEVKCDIAKLDPYNETGLKPECKVRSGGCYGAMIGPGDRYVAIPFRIRRNAGACFQVKAEGFGQDVPITVTLRTMDKQRLSQLRIGISGELRTSKTAWVANAEDGSRTRHNYRFGEDIVEFVVSNMAAIPGNTVNQTAALIFAVGGMEMGAASPSGSSGTTGEATPDDPEAQIRERMARAAPRVTRNGPGTAMVKRRERQQEIVISLGSVPEALQVLDEVNLSGSLAGLSRGQDTARQAMSGEPAVIAAVTDAIARDDRVKITIPLVDYGFTGSFDKAEIELKRHQDQDLYALEPVSRDPNGQVTITEYSRDFMSGTFSAQLVEKYEHTGNGYRRVPRDQTLTIVKNVSGRFWVPTPWLTDRSVEIEPVDTLAEDVTADITQWMPGDITNEVSDKLQQAIRAESGEPQGHPGPAPGPSVSAADPVLGCSCTCENKDKEALIPECVSRCQMVWLTCETPESEALLDQQLAELQLLLSGSGLPQSTRDMLVESFRQIPPSMRETALEAHRKSFQRH